MPSNPRVILDISLLISHTGLLTGIQKLETNLLAYMQAQPVDDRQFVSVCFENKSTYQLDGLYHGKALPYLLRVFFSSRNLWHLNRLAKTVVNNRVINEQIDHYSQRQKWLLAPLLVILPTLAANVVWLARMNRRKLTWHKGDALLIPALSWFAKGYPTLLRELDNKGVAVSLYLHDLFPMTAPKYSSKLMEQRFNDLLPMITGSISTLIVNSEFTLTEFNRIAYDKKWACPKKIVVRTLGVDVVPSQSPFVASLPTNNLPSGSLFLCVGTLEKRKNQGYILDAFELLWKQTDLKLKPILVIVGQRGSATQLMQRLERHPQRNKHLFWFDRLGDPALEGLYDRARCAINASKMEGFGLPVFEALIRRLPVLASDIPVFREISDEYCDFFKLDNAAALSQLILAKMKQAKSEDAQRLHSFKHPSWYESCDAIIKSLF